MSIHGVCLNNFNPDVDTGSIIVSPSKLASIPPPASPVKTRKVDLAHEFRKVAERDKSHYKS